MSVLSKCGRADFLLWGNSLPMETRWNVSGPNWCGNTLNSDNTHTNTDTLIYTHLFSLHQGSGRLSLLPALIGSRLSGTDGRSVLRLTRALPHHRINSLFSMSDDNNELLRSRGLSAATRGVWSSYFVWKLLNDKTEQKFKLKWTWEATEEQNGECKHTFCFWKTGHNKKA